MSSFWTFIVHQFSPLHWPKDNLGITVLIEKKSLSFEGCSLFAQDCALDTSLQVDCVSCGIVGKLMGSHEQWLRTVFFCSQPGHRPTLNHQLKQRRKPHIAQPGVKPRTSRILCEQADHWATEPHGRPVLNYNLLGNMPEPTRQSLCCSQLKYGSTKCQR